MRNLLLRLAFFLSILLISVACNSQPKLPEIPADGVIVAFGDSITYGTNAERSQSYPAVLEGLLGRKVVNAGVPGEVTAQGVERLPGVLEENSPALLLLCLGGNDFLRRLDEKQAEENLKAMISMARQKGIPVVLLGVPQPGVFLKTHPLYGRIAKETGIPCEEEALQEILADRALKSDPIHPNAAGYRRLAEEVAALLGECKAVRR